LTDATEIKQLDDIYNEADGYYITYEAILLNVDNSSASGAYDLGQPSDWKNSTTLWKDGYYCNVETTEYVYINEPDSYWTGL
jgi:hypothetical protein